MEVARDKYYKIIRDMEDQLRCELEIDINIFHVEGEPVGFGDYGRKYKLWQDIELKGTD